MRGFTAERSLSRDPGPGFNVILAAPHVTEEFPFLVTPLSTRT
jgi:hypothetical protein